jgi:hypothetical protein
MKICPGLYEPKILLRTMPSLLADLRQLELELHHPGVHCTPERLEQLLHAEFHEVGRSGRRYGREMVIQVLSSQTRPPPVESQDFVVKKLSTACALLTYRSTHRHPDGRVGHALRSSVWLRGASGWQLYYHQGTPAASDP